MYKRFTTVLLLSGILSQPINKTNTLEIFLKNHRLSNGGGGGLAQILNSYHTAKKSHDDHLDFSQGNKMGDNRNLINKGIQYLDPVTNLLTKEKQAEDSEGRNQKLNSNWEDYKKEYVAGGESDWKGYNSFEGNDARSYTNDWKDNQESHYKKTWNGIDSGNIGKGWILPVMGGGWNGISGGGGSGDFIRGWNRPVSGKSGYLQPTGCCLFGNSGLGNGWNSGGNFGQGWSGYGYGNIYDSGGFAKGLNALSLLKNKWYGIGSSLGNLLGSFSLFGKKKLPIGWNSYIINC